MGFINDTLTLSTDVIYFDFSKSFDSGACPGDAGGRRPLFEMLTYNFC